MVEIDHSLAKSIFEEIRSRPYRLSLKKDIKVNNCYFKGIELLSKLGSLGYTVRARIAEIDWNNGIIPKEAINLLPKDIPQTHFFVEVLIDNK